MSFNQQTHVPPPDAFIIEELPEDLECQADDEVHDQLPSVEEYKANNNFQSRGSSKKTMMYGVAVIFILVVAITGIVVSTNNKKESKPATTADSAVGRTQQLEEFLYNSQVSTLPQLQEVGSSHHQAVAFIADGDLLQLQITASEAGRLVERFVLAVIFYELGGFQWTYGLNFLTGLDHCEWNGFFETGNGNQIRQGVSCDKDGFVTAIDLAWNNLKGKEIPDMVKHLTRLETFHVYYSEIGGDFPDAFRKLTNLKSIALMKTGLVGTLPQWIGELTQLTTLALGDNHMHGDIPDSIESLKKLRILGLDGNNGFTGSIEKLKSLSNLEALYLENNVLTGNLYNFNWPQLVELDISNNALDQSVPVELFNHPTLEVLDIHGNMMFGSFPDDIFENTKLEFFAAHNAGFSGTVPDRIAFLKALKHLDISFNGFTGTIPDTITQMFDLRSLVTSGNHFVAQPMMDMSKMTNLKDLSMKSNNMVGSIPDWIGELTGLQRLDLSTNELTGTIPSWIGLIQSLDQLLLNRNKLHGTIPMQIQNMHHLKVLLLDGNSMTGNANAVCNSESVNPTHFVADCYPGANGESPEIECRCCTQCCTDDNPSCNDKVWPSNVDSILDYGSIRSSYSFNLENAPVLYSEPLETEDESELSGGLR